VRRHLTQTQAVSALRRGRAIEQLLEPQPRDGLETVRWLSVFGDGDAFIVNVHHVYDACDPELVDITEFAPVNDEESVARRKSHRFVGFLAMLAIAAILASALGLGLRVVRRLRRKA
jgi:hypothetical protein